MAQWGPVGLILAGSGTTFPAKGEPVGAMTRVSRMIVRSEKNCQQKCCVDLVHRMTQDG